MDDRVVAPHAKRSSRDASNSVNANSVNANSVNANSVNANSVNGRGEHSHAAA